MAMGVGAAWMGTTPLAGLATEPTARFSAADVVALGKTGIQTSGLACGTGAVGANHQSHPTALDIQA